MNAKVVMLTLAWTLITAYVVFVVDHVMQVRKQDPASRLLSRSKEQVSRDINKRWARRSTWDPVTGQHRGYGGSPVENNWGVDGPPSYRVEPSDGRIADCSRCQTRLGLAVTLDPRAEAHAQLPLVGDYR